MSDNSSVGVNPGFQELSLQPGETYHGTFEIINPDIDISNSMDYKIFVSPFSVSGEDYSISFESENDYTQISNWISLEQKSGTIKGGEVIEVPFTINVPKDAPGGGQYASFIVRSVDQKNSSDGYVIGINRQVASILYTSISGTTRQEGKVLKNSIQGFVSGSQISATSLVENTGNVHFDTNYILQVFPLFSNDAIYSNEESPKVNTVLPNTTLSTENSWSETPQLGIFRVVQTVSYLGNSSIVEKTVFVCPLWFIVLWIVFIFGGIFWIFTNSRARKKAKKRADKYAHPHISR